MIKTLFFKELREARWKLIIGTGISILTGAFLPYGFDIIRESAGLFSKIPMLSSIYEQIELQASDYRVYLWANWYGKNLPQYVMVLAAIAGGTALAGERSSGTFLFLLSRPVSRVQVFLAKYLAGAAVIAATVLGGTIATLIAASAIGSPVASGWFVSGIPAQILGGLCLLSLAVLFSAVLDDPVKAGVAGFASSVGLMVLESVTPARGRLIFSMMAAGRSFSSGLPHLVPLLIMAAVSALIGLLALRTFCKSDL